MRSKGKGRTTCTNDARFKWPRLSVAAPSGSREPFPQQFVGKKSDSVGVRLVLEDGAGAEEQARRDAWDFREIVRSLHAPRAKFAHTLEQLERQVLHDGITRSRGIIR